MLLLQQIQVALARPGWCMMPVIWKCLTGLAPSAESSIGPCMVTWAAVCPLLHAVCNTRAFRKPISKCRGVLLDTLGIQEPVRYGPYCNIVGVWHQRPQQHAKARQGLSQMTLLSGSLGVELI
eukprot:GHRR01036033.1.p1 GENE.GHRR01036033.1~~GHRR01036033.1.p1  ORF type:complete len:123 (-),score=4.87 GHRR01036033.1:125-493(-)